MRGPLRERERSVEIEYSKADNSSCYLLLITSIRIISIITLIIMMMIKITMIIAFVIIVIIIIAIINIIIVSIIVIVIIFYVIITRHYFCVFFSFHLLIVSLLLIYLFQLLNVSLFIFLIAVINFISILFTKNSAKPMSKIHLEIDNQFLVISFLFPSFAILSVIPIISSSLLFLFVYFISYSFSSLMI